MVEGEKFKRIALEGSPEGIDTFSQMSLPDTFDRLVADHPQGVILFVRNTNSPINDITHKPDTTSLMEGYTAPSTLFTDGNITEIPNGMGVQPETYACWKLPIQPRGIPTPVYSLVTSLPREEVERARQGFGNEIAPIHVMDFQMFIDRSVINRNN